MAGVAFMSYLMRICEKAHAAVQYALLTSFMQLLGKFLITPSSGFLVDGMGWIHWYRADEHYPPVPEYEFVDELPKTATGKIQRFKLRDDA